MRWRIEANKETEREREKGYKGETNGEVNGSYQVLVEIAADVLVKNRNVSAANQRIIIGGKKLKPKNRWEERRIQNRKLGMTM